MTDSGIWNLFALGINTVFIPFEAAPTSLDYISSNPKYSTRPYKVISPIKAWSYLTFFPTIKEYMATKIANPEYGPFF